LDHHSANCQFLLLDHLVTLRYHLGESVRDVLVAMWAETVRDLGTPEGFERKGLVGAISKMPSRPTTDCHPERR
jgi:hypothetical protein